MSWMRVWGMLQLLDKRYVCFRNSIINASLYIMQANLLCEECST